MSEENTTNEQASAPADNQKVLAGVLGIVLGALGVHKFVLGYTKEGIIMLLVTLLTFGIGGTVMAIIGLIEGIMYLTKTDAEFTETYITNKKTWFWFFKATLTVFKDNSFELSFLFRRTYLKLFSTRLNLNNWSINVK